MSLRRPEAEIEGVLNTPPSGGGKPRGSAGRGLSLPVVMRLYLFCLVLFWFGLFWNTAQENIKTTRFFPAVERKDVMLICRPALTLSIDGGYVDRSMSIMRRKCLPQLCLTVRTRCKLVSNSGHARAP